MIKKSSFNLIFELKSFLTALIGFTLLAITVNFFSWQFKLISGGFPGFGLFISYLTGFPVGMVLMVLNIFISLVLFIFGDNSLGIKSAIGYFLFPILVDFTRSFLGLTQNPNLSFVSSAMMVTLQAFFAGFAVTLFFSQQYSSGGWGALAFVIKKYFHINGPQFLFLMDILLTILITLTIGLSKGILLGLNSLVFYYAFKYSLNFYYKRFPKS